jgi:hypothetical protein
MFLSSFVVALSLCSGVWAAPVEQQPLAGNNRHAGPHGKPFTPDHRDPYDGKIDSVGDKLQPLPWVSHPSSVMDVETRESLSKLLRVSTVLL